MGTRAAHPGLTVDAFERQRQALALVHAVRFRDTEGVEVVTRDVDSVELALSVAAVAVAMAHLAETAIDQLLRTPDVLEPAARRAREGRPATAREVCLDQERLLRVLSDSAAGLH